MYFTSHIFSHKTKTQVPQGCFVHAAPVFQMCIICSFIATSRARVMIFGNLREIVQRVRSTPLAAYACVYLSIKQSRTIPSSTISKFASSIIRSHSDLSNPDKSAGNLYFPSCIVALLSVSAGSNCFHFGNCLFMRRTLRPDPGSPASAPCHGSDPALFRCPPETRRPSASGWSAVPMRESLPACRISSCSPAP